MTWIVYTDFCGCSAWIDLGHGDNTKTLTCAIDRVDTAQNNCRQRITAFDRVVTVIDTSKLAVDCESETKDSRFLPANPQEEFEHNMNIQV